MFGGTQIPEMSEAEIQAAVEEMTEAVMNAIIDCCTHDDGSLTVSTHVIFRSLILSTGAFMAFNPEMDHRPARRDLCNLAARSLAEAIVSSRDDMKASEGQYPFGMH
jgi:hypothetical protein